MTRLRRAMFYAALAHLQNEVPTDLNQQEQARNLLFRLVQEDLGDPNNNNLIKCAHVILRNEYVEPGDLQMNQGILAANRRQVMGMRELESTILEELKQVTQLALLLRGSSP